MEGPIEDLVIEYLAVEDLRKKKKQGELYGRFLCRRSSDGRPGI